MNIEDLKIGEIYTYKQGEYHHIFILESINGSSLSYNDYISKYVPIRSKSYYDYHIGGAGNTFNKANFFYSTEIEKQWLNKCIKEQKLIPLEDIQMYYEIY